MVTTFSRFKRLGVALVLCVCAQFAYAVPLPEDVVMYEVNPRAFSQAGDLAGVTARLDEIQSLGVNTLWLMPIHPVGQINSVGQLGSPYSVQNYGQVSSEYGGLSEMTTLVSEAHSRGMYVLMDWVANHTAWDHPWITSHPEWYSQNQQGQIISPPGTNWSDVADLNYDNTAMRSAMINEMQYWVTQVGVDGFRTDAADFVPFDFWQAAITTVRGSTGNELLMLAEGARSDHYAAGFDMTWGFGFFDTLESVFNDSASARFIGLKHHQEYAQIPEGKSILRYTTNHDESAWNATPPVLFGGLDASLAAYAATLAYGGTPLIYNGQEIGWINNVPIFSQSPLDWTTGQATAEWYTDLLSIHNQHEALREGTLVDRSNSNVVLVLRETLDDEVLVAVNARNFASTVQIPTEWQGEWFNSLDESMEILTSEITLAPYEVLYFTQAIQSGDFDLDGAIDGNDFLKWQRGESPAPLSLMDLSDWQSGYGTLSNTLLATTIVPEPNAIFLTSLSIVFCIVFSRVRFSCL